ADRARRLGRALRAGGGRRRRLPRRPAPLLCERGRAHRDRLLGRAARLAAGGRALRLVARWPASPAAAGRRCSACRPPAGSTAPEIDLERFRRVLAVEGDVGELAAARDLAEELLEERVEALRLLDRRGEARGVEQV